MPQLRNRASSGAFRACISGAWASDGLGAVDLSVGLTASRPCFTASPGADLRIVNT